MKLIPLSSAAVLVTLLVLVPMSSGLDCYDCVVGDGLNEANKYHKKCKEGDLPDSLAVTCDQYNSIDAKTRQPLNASEVELSLKQGLGNYGCAKLQAKVNKDEITAKRCTYTYGRPEKQDYCETANLDVGQDTVKGTSCVCYTDKCNGAGTSGAQAGSVILALIAVVTRIGV